jgi:hypothetical protein
MQKAEQNTEFDPEFFAFREKLRKHFLTSCCSVYGPPNRVVVGKFPVKGVRERG